MTQTIILVLLYCKLLSPCMDESVHEHASMSWLACSIVYLWLSCFAYTEIIFFIDKDCGMIFMDVVAVEIYSWIGPFNMQDKQPIKQTLEEEARRCQWLVLWLDCDREGENIAYEVIKVCTGVNSHLNIWRARFSALIDRYWFFRMVMVSFPVPITRIF